MAELSSDDGEMDTIFSDTDTIAYIYIGETGSYISNRFEAPSPGCYLVGFKANLNVPADGCYFNLCAWDEEDDMPGTALYPSWSVYPDSGEGWVEEPMPNVPLGDVFYIGWQETEAPVSIAFDTDDFDGISWVYLSDYGWFPFSEAAEPFNTMELMIRALVVTPEGKLVELSPRAPTPADRFFTSHSFGSGNSLALRNMHPFNLKPSSVIRTPTDIIHPRVSSIISTEGLTGYKIYRSVSPFETTDEAELIAELDISGLDLLSYEDTYDISTGIDYYYRMTAVYDEGESELSETAIGSAVGIAPPAQILVLDLDDGDLLADNGTSDESDVLVSLLEEVGITDVLVSEQNESFDRFDLTPDNYEAIFIIAGSYPWDGKFGDDECNALSAYLDAGGKIYMEGVDNGYWYGNPGSGTEPPSSEAGLNFWYHFRINYDYDGENAATGNVQTLETNPTFFRGNFGVNYDCQTDADAWVDELSSDGADIIMRSTSPAYFISSGRMSYFEHPTSGYVAINSAVYLGAMSHFTLPNIRTRLLGSILDAFGIPNTNVPEETASTPTKFSLSQNHPNPFNGATLINFTLPEKGDISLEVHNLVGQKVATIASGIYKAGTHKVTWQTPSDLSAGIYFYTLKYDGGCLTKKLLYLK